MPRGEKIRFYFATGIQRGTSIEQSPIFQKIDDGPIKYKSFEK
jgi:hypothetical protein